MIVIVIVFMEIISSDGEHLSEAEDRIRTAELPAVVSSILISRVIRHVGLNSSHNATSVSQNYGIYVETNNTSSCSECK